MSSQTIKIAISLPKDKFKIIESLRHKRSISRSALIYEAIQHWLECKKEKELIRRYEEGYIENPELSVHITSLEKACVAKDGKFSMSTFTARVHNLFETWEWANNSKILTKIENNLNVIKIISSSEFTLESGVLLTKKNIPQILADMKEVW